MCIQLRLHERLIIYEANLAEMNNGKKEKKRKRNRNIRSNVAYMTSGILYISDLNREDHLEPRIIYIGTIGYYGLPQIFVPDEPRCCR